MISDIFAKESIISYFRSDIIAGPEGFGKKPSKFGLNAIRKRVRWDGGQI
jgi:hypothetical protein